MPYKKDQKNIKRFNSVHLTKRKQKDREQKDRKHKPQVRYGRPRGQRRFNIHRTKSKYL